MKTLLLTSQGIQPEIKETFLSLLEKSPQKTSVAFITTAAYGENKDPVWLEIYRNQLRDCGIGQIEDIDLRNMKQTTLKQALSNKDILFVNGGNTFYLLKWVRKSGFGQTVKEFIDRGGLYVGVSAGSYIACPTIEQSLWKQKFRDRKTFGLKDLTALNLVPFLLTAHFSEKYRPVIEKAADQTRYPVVALSDTQAILVRDEKIQFVGKGRKNFYNGFKETVV